MSSIQETAVQKAIGFLKAAGAQYKIILGETVVADTLPVAAGKKWTKSGVKYKDVYGAAVDTLDQPDTYYAEIRVPAEINVEKTRGALAAVLATKFGSGSCITSVNKETRTIEILRAR